jgi:hypothetical protein
MTNTAAAKTNARSNDAAKWPVRFGTMTRLALKQGKSGQFAVITVQCKGFEQTAVCFNADVIAKMKAAGEGSRVWFKGPIESVQKTGYSEDQMKVIYFSANEPRSAETGKGEGEGEGAETNAEAGAVSEETAAVAQAQDETDDVPF